jgi:hypothetical protein
MIAMIETRQAAGTMIFQIAGYITLIAAGLIRQQS